MGIDIAKPLSSLRHYVAEKLVRLFHNATQLTLSSQISAATSLLFLATILTIGTVSLKAYRSELKNVLIAQQNTLIYRIADDLDQRLLMLQRALIVSAKTVRAEDIASSDAAQHFLDADPGLHAVFDRSIFLFSPQGKLVAETPFLPNRRGQDFSFRLYIKETLRTGKPVISEPFVTTKDDHNAVVMMTAPVFAEDGQIIAILTGSFGLTRPEMLGNIEKTVIGRTGYLSVVTADGKLIMYPDKTRLSKPAYVAGANPLFDRALAGFDGTEENVDTDGRAVLTSYKRIPAPGWIISARYPVDEAFRPYASMVTRFVELLGAACILVLVAVWSLTRDMLRPLASLTRELKNHSASTGQVAPVNLQAKGEIGELERAFNALVERLLDREAALVDTMQTHQLITDNSTDLITKHRPDGVISWVSPVCRSLLGIASHDIVNHSVLEFVHPMDREIVRNTFIDAAQHGELKVLTYRMRRANHDYIWFETTLRLMHREGGGTNEILCVSRDITERKGMEQHLHQLARQDALTGLPNRILLSERIGIALDQAARDNLAMAILMIDLDRFKNINDTLGHSAGDTVLQLAAGRLKSCIRPSDTLSRWGGDEFVLLLPSLPSAESALEIAERCLVALRDPFVIEAQCLRISTSIGVSIFPLGGKEAEILVKNADTAMYRAKSLGGDCYCIYAPEMNAEAQSRLAMENELYVALERNQLRVYYQPIISAKTGRVVAAEALLRWMHPEHGMILPGQFIPIAEDTGLIGPIGDWVLEKGCAQMALWRTHGLPPMGLSVNLSSRQFRQDALVSTIRRILDETGFDPSLLELEMTESLLMDNVQRSSQIMDELKSIGLKISVDDFGTGYSSLSYLKRFPLDTLKIDRSFVNDVTKSDSDASIVRATIALARSLQLKIVAEGVETKEQANFLIEHGCDQLQGFLYAAPMPESEFLPFALASPTFLLSKKVTA